ncbi:MAG: alpha/beta hydrolase [Acidobacteriota bacterium]
MPKRSTQQPQPSNRRTPAYRPPPPNSQYGTKPFEQIDARWILNALGAMIVFAIFCAWLLLCFVFIKTQWQYVLHPSRTVAATPANAGLAFSEVHFGPDASGQPQLDGWWIPADSATTPTVLLLHSGDGSMSDALPTAHQLHDANLSVLLFDYRGYGHSLGQHPSQQLMQTDAASALTYLTDSRKIPATSILVEGIGAGASLAIQLCADHKEIPALILDSATGDFKQQMIHDQHAKAVPVQLLFTQDFPLTTPLSKLSTPKLLITSSDATPQPYQSASDPKTILHLPTSNSAAFHDSLRRFLDTYVPAPTPTLTQ